MNPNLSSTMIPESLSDWAIRRSLRVLLPALVISLLFACTTGPPSTVHGSHGFVVSQQVLDSTDWDRSLEGFSGSVPFDAETDLRGIRYEHFTSSSSSWLIGLLEREYEIDLPDADSGEGLEFLWEGRSYFTPENRLQPFFGGGLRIGEGLDWVGGLESNVYFGFEFGGGLAYFDSSGFVVEFRLDYELTHITTDIPGGVTFQDQIDGVTGQVGIGWVF